MTEIAAGVWAFDRAVRFASRVFLSFSYTSSEASHAKKFPSIKCATALVSSLDATSSKYTRLRITLPASRLRLPGQSRLPGGIAAGDDIRVTIPRLQWVGEHPSPSLPLGCSRTRQLKATLTFSSRPKPESHARCLNW
ncbi:hypothetical protein L1887_52151 [Cichorium endivia]|nr:hypothetical protein L1887_52151 [Cichorium endivia]